jgi:hypothetical protein
MQTSNETLKDRLARYRQIKLSVVGRKSEQTISIPVWFVLEGEKLYLLPVQGSDTQWYKNVLQNPSIRIDARGGGAEFHFGQNCGRQSRLRRSERRTRRALVLQNRLDLAEAPAGACRGFGRGGLFRQAVPERDVGAIV